VIYSLPLSVSILLLAGVVRNLTDRGHFTRNHSQIILYDF